MDSGAARKNHKANTHKQKPRHTIYIFTNFSVYSWPQKHGFPPHKSPIKTEEDYYNWLYSDDRMYNRFKSFTRITVPSIKAQTYKNYKWLLFYSEKMPAKYFEKLRHSLKDILNYELIPVESVIDAEHIFTNYPKRQPYITLRIDDDDGLHPTYFQHLQDIARPGGIYAPKHGYRISFNHGTIMGAKDTHAPTFISVGLARVGASVKGLGNHVTISKRFKHARHIDKEGMFLITSGNHTFTHRPQHTGAKPFHMNSFLKQKDPFTPHKNTNVQLRNVTRNTRNTRNTRQKHHPQTSGP